MNCARNIITANFSGGGTSATTAPLWQWDYGQVLCITGIEDLPAAFEVHFSTNRTGGVSTVAVGADGQVTIPNVLLTIGKNLNAWIYLSDAQGEGETEYSITTPVKARPMPETYDAEATGEFDDVVRQVSEYAQTAQTAADNAGASATAAAGSASAAAASASSAAGSASAAEQAKADAVTAKGQAETAAQTATEKAKQSAQSASQAALDAGRAESAAQSAETAQTGAGAAKTAAEAAAQSAAASASAASASATSAGQSANAAAQSASAAAQSAASIEGDVQIASQKASEAQTAAGQAVTAKEAAQTAQQGAETAATNAGQSASTATAKAAEAATSASGAAQSKTDAEAAAARAEQAAATLTVDDALSDTSTNPVQNKVVTAEVTQVKNAIDALKITDTASGAIASFPDGAAMPMESLTVEMSPIQSGSGDPSPDNVRPITGRDAVTVTRTGINVWDEAWELGTFNANGKPVASSNNVRTKNFISVKPGTAYYFRVPTVGITAFYYDADKSCIGVFAVSSSQVKTTDANAMFMKFRTGALTTYNHDISINYPSTDTEYHASEGIDAATVQLGQTVYGGTVDVTGGESKSKLAMVDAGTLTWAKGNNVFYASIVGKKIGLASISTLVCDRYATHASGFSTIPNCSICGNASYAYVYIRDDAHSDDTAAEFKSAMSGVQICYELATPTEIETTPVEMTTLKGQNNVWSDADSVSVEYVADPKLYIARLTEPDADMVADANITSGSYFMVGNTLYLATTNIASGAAIVPGVNCTKTNLSAALNAINA